jgi:SAM-dependent methyltransferase
MTRSLSLNVREPDRLGRKNVTRETSDLPRKFLRERKLHFLTLYWLMMQSDLGREGIEHSGSYRFADHIYRNRPSGRNWLGRMIDAWLLRMPATRAFHRRYRRAQDAICSKLSARSGNEPIRVLAVPCGIPRDLSELPPHLLADIEYIGIDLDPEVLLLAERHLARCKLAARRFVLGNALDGSAYPEQCDCAISTGLGEFLSDDELLTLYRNVHSTLAPGGIFYTSATNFEPRSEAMLDAFELRTHYRDATQLGALLETLPWRSLQLTVDPTGLQTFVVATK